MRLPLGKCLKYVGFPKMSLLATRALQVSYFSLSVVNQTTIYLLARIQGPLAPSCLTVSTPSCAFVKSRNSLLHLGTTQWLTICLLSGSYTDILAKICVGVMFPLWLYSHPEYSSLLTPSQTLEMSKDDP